METTTVSAVIAIALFIEALVQVIKPLYNKQAKRFSVPELISVIAGIIVAVIGKVNLLEGLIITDSIVGLYIIYGLSGIALGRGPSFVHDLWKKIKVFNVDTATEAATFAEQLAKILSSIFTIKEKEQETETPKQE